jgi:hypothetical protein
MLKVRDRQELTREDWTDWWIIREFGKTKFSLREILAGGRDWHQRLVNTMAAYFYYVWDEEIGRQRDATPTREEVLAYAEAWVTVLMENVVLDQRDRGEDIDGQVVDFSTFQNRADTQAVR